MARTKNEDVAAKTGEIVWKKVPEAKVWAAWRVRITLLTDMLGTKPCSADIAQRFLQSKMTKLDRMQRDLTEEDRIAKANEAVESAEKALTIFYKDDGGNPLIQGYQILGFLKEAALTQSNDKGKCASNFFAGSLKGKIEQAYNVRDYTIEIRLPEGYTPYEYYLNENGEERKRWKQLERPLRTEMRGVTVTSLAKSEIIPAGSVMEFTLELRSETIPVASGKAAARVVAEDMLMELLGEGGRRGLGQWRNAGHGRFSAEIADLA